MTYDVQIGNLIRRGIPYAELAMLPIDSESYVRRANEDWIKAKNCIELTHILTQNPSISSSYTTPVSQLEIYDYSPNEYVEEEIDDYEDNVADERIFIPTDEYFKCKQKREAAIIGVCTFGLAGLSLMGVRNTWRSNIFAGTSFSVNAGIGLILKCLSFCLLTALIAIPYFIYSVFALINYSIKLNNLKR